MNFDDNLGRKLAKLRAELGWTQKELATNIAERASSLSGVLRTPVSDRTIRAWESGKPIKQAAERAAIHNFLERNGALSAVPVQLPADSICTLETRTRAFLAEIRVSDVPDSVVDAIRFQVAEQCAAYLVAPVEQTLSESLRTYDDSLRLWQEKRLRPKQKTELLHSLNKLMLLIACLYNDLDKVREAELWRSRAAQLAFDVGHREMQAWCFEILSWFAVNAAPPRPLDAVRWAEAGQSLVRSTSVLPQLILKEANGHAQLGWQKQAETALHRAVDVAAALPIRDTSTDHFDVDHLRLTFFAIQTRRAMGQDEQVLLQGKQLLKRLDGLDETALPSFRTEVLLSLAISCARLGALNDSYRYLTSALKIEGRQTLPSFQLCLTQIADALAHQNATTEQRKKFTHLTRGRLGPKNPLTKIPQE